MTTAIHSVPAPAELDAPPLAGSDFDPTGLNLAALKRRTDYVALLMRDHMVPGRHYGSIPGKDKPCLHKSGAELLLDAFGFRFYSEITQRVQDWETGFVEYEVRVVIVNASGNVEADGHGCCNSLESRYKNQDAANIANTLLKIAKKRALVDATLAATRSSILFTQDLDERRSSAHGTVGLRAGTSSAALRGGDQLSRPISNPGDLRTENQAKLLWTLAKEIHEQNPEAVIRHHAGKPLATILKGEASNLIDELRLVLAQGQQKAA